MEAPWRVLICDDSLGFPTLIRTWLREDARFEPVGVAKSAAEARELVPEHRPDVLVLDLLLPDAPDPAQLVRALREAHPPLRIMLVSSLQQDALEERGLAAGADGVCTKGATAEVLTERLYAVASADGSSTQKRLP